MRVELRADFFNLLNRANFQLFNTSDVLDVLSVPSPAVKDPVTKKLVSNPNYTATCTSCINPLTGFYIGSGGEVLHLRDLQHGKVSKDLTNPTFALIGDPASTDIPRQIQLSIRVRF